jgi:hypothetical protein
MLVFDFDSGQAANNVLDLLGKQSDLGFGADEVGVYIGDSGGPLFIDGSVAGLNRAILGGLDGDYTTVEDGSWGELAFVTRISSYEDFIASATGGQAVFMPSRGGWNIDGSGDWSAAANWTSSPPNGSGSPAVFGPVITSPQTVTVDIPVTVGRVQFNNSHAYTLAGNGPITLDAVSGDALINVVTGNHVIAAPINLTDDTLITISPATSSLAITGGLNASGVSITKAGKGSLTVNNIRALGLSVDDGIVVVAFSSGAPDQSTSVVNSLSIAGDGAPTATLDLTNSAAVINYTGISPAATIREQILAGRGGAGLGGTWTGSGITSSTAAAANQAANDSRSLGYAENATLPLGAYATFRGQPVDNTSLLIAYTRTGDANLDGMVDNNDVAIVGANYAPGLPKARWDLGDFDYNGFVDNDDITLLGAFYNPTTVPIISAAPRPATGLAAVPEPTALSLFVVAAAVIVLSRSRRAFLRGDQ